MNGTLGVNVGWMVIAIILGTHHLIPAEASIKTA